VEDAFNGMQPAIDEHTVSIGSRKMPCADWTGGIKLVHRRGPMLTDRHCSSAHASDSKDIQRDNSKSGYLSVDR
jgi:hypothetical protein